MTSRRRQASLPLARCIPAPKKKRPTRRDGYTRRRRPLPDLPHSIAYQLTGLSAVAAILAGMRLHRPARRGIWYGLAGGLPCSSPAT
jgi:hypothetical protein